MFPKWNPPPIFSTCNFSASTVLSFMAIFFPCQKARAFFREEKFVHQYEVSPVFGKRFNRSLVRTGVWRRFWNRAQALRAAERRRKSWKGCFYFLRQTLLCTKPWFKRGSKEIWRMFMSRKSPVRIILLVFSPRITSSTLLNRARERHINFEHINFLKVGATLGQPAG